MATTTTEPNADVARPGELTPKQVRLVRTAYQAFTEDGVHRVSLQEIADRAGVSKGVILYHFATRDRFILATMHWALSRTAERIRRAVATADSPEAQVEAMIDAIFFDADANRRFYLLYLDLLDYASRMDRFGELNATFRSIVNSTYGDVVRLGMTRGVFPDGDVEETADVVRAIIDGMFLLWLQETDWKAAHPRYREATRRAVLTFLRALPAG